jgi:hypothetical protein
MTPRRASVSGAGGRRTIEIRVLPMSGVGLHRKDRVLLGEVTSRRLGTACGALGNRV